MRASKSMAASIQTFCYVLLIMFVSLCGIALSDSAIQYPVAVTKPRYLPSLSRTSVGHYSRQELPSTPKLMTSVASIIRPRRRKNPLIANISRIGGGIRDILHLIVFGPISFLYIFLCGSNGTDKQCPFPRRSGM